MDHNTNNGYLPQDTRPHTMYTTVERTQSAFNRVTSRLFKRKNINHDHFAIDMPSGSNCGQNTPESVSNSPPKENSQPRRLQQLPGVIENWVTGHIGLSTGRASRHAALGRWGSVSDRRANTSATMSRYSSGTRRAQHSRYTHSIPTRMDRKRHTVLPLALTLFHPQKGGPMASPYEESTCPPSPKRLCTPDQGYFDKTAIFDDKAGESGTYSALGNHKEVRAPQYYTPDSEPRALSSLGVEIPVSHQVSSNNSETVMSPAGDTEESVRSLAQDWRKCTTVCEPSQHLSSSPFYSDASTETLISQPTLESDSASFDAEETLQPEDIVDRVALSTVDDGFDQIERDTYCWLEKQEPRYLADPAWLRRHPELNVHMRPVLVDWMLEVGADYHLHRSTVHMAVNFLDRFLSSSEDVTRDILQCLATACLSLAIKLEEYTCPKLRELVDLAQGAFDLQQLKRAEHIVVKAIQWQLTPPTAQHWLPLYYQRAAKVKPHVFQAHSNSPVIPAKSVTATSAPLLNSSIVRHLPQYHRDWFVFASDIMDIALHHQRSLSYSYSTLAAAAFFLTTTYFTPRELTEDLFFQVTGRTFQDVAECVAFLRTLAGDLLLNVPKGQMLPKFRFGPNYLRHHRDDSYSYQTHHSTWLPVIQKHTQLPTQ
ncbi:G1/S-specific cyclin-E2 [Dispira parvispora]|uniref:G1/S-specific cyclin-E2 n=1 Tax=Dispira parvispora TaxID=1520584 RepID=A0A9W8AVQ3_9FUNG|nr:G1/S-specific cyclin-E2 [Dispira parvispora]